MAAAAAVSTSAVTISSITAGSTLVVSVTTVTDSAAAAGFESTLTSSVSSVFTSSSFSAYGTPTASNVGTSEVVMAATLTPTSAPTEPPTSVAPTTFGTTVMPTVAPTATSAGTLPLRISPPPSNGCLVDNGGCDPLTSCMYDDHGVHCTECPGGYTEANGSNGTVACLDIDECAMDNGGCDPLTRCSNGGGSYSCGPCPEGYAGDGEAGCWLAVECTEDLCDPLTTCSIANGAATCSSCPDGYVGSGDTACVDVDGCATGACFEGVECTDVAAPGVGYTCGPCPATSTGDGMTCVADVCAASPAACSGLVTCSVLQSGAAVCGSCPQGYKGDGYTDGTGCADVDECVSSNGGCHYLTTCINTEGGVECGECPDGYIGSGSSGCKDASALDCGVENGGCWTNGVVSVTCEIVGEELRCGDCPAGYEGNGYDGCRDTPGCYSGACSEHAACQDVMAPGTGYTCGACSSGYLGDGERVDSARADAVGCYENKCFLNNGGCDTRVSCTNDLTAASGRVCGSCPQGYVDTYLDGSLCSDQDGCQVDPCFPGVLCVDLPAPQVGRTCAECPTGYAGDGDRCEDINECADDADPPFGGCYRDADVVTSCTNVQRTSEVPEGRVCGACPEGYKGAGETACVLVTTCASNNGGCWVGSGEHYAQYSTKCTDVEGEGTLCGPCPAGFQGTGDTGCIDVDGCSDAPCFPGVTCQDVRAPGSGHVCEYLGPLETSQWSCPEGYHGDGQECTLCQLSTSVAGNERQTRLGADKGQRMQVSARTPVLDPPECTNQEGFTFIWEGATSEGGVLALSDEVNKANTLKLTIPKADLAVGLNYQLVLKAYLLGMPSVRDEATFAFYVDSQPLVVLLRGGNATAGVSSPVMFSAADSIDPDGESGEISFSWSCARADTPTACRLADGIELPSLLTDAVLSLSLEGDPRGANYTLEVVGSKGTRASSASTWLTIFQGALPTVEITPLSSKVNPTDKLTLDGQVTSDDVALQLEWNYQALTTGEVPFPLDSTTLMTGTDQESLVVRPDVLTAGASYRFSLHATNSVGTATTSLDVIVNRAPQGGGVDVTPSQGVALSTTFVILTHDWEDDDGQLWHQILYRLEGQGDESWSPITSDYNMLLDPYTMSAVIPLAGVEEFEHAVTVRVAVQDALGATATAETRITVTPAEDLDTGAVLATAEGDLRNGNVDSSMQLISGLSGALNEEAPRRVKRRRRTLLQSSAEAPARQRESMLDMVTEVEGILFATTATIATLVSAVGQIVEAPCELYPSVQTKALSLAQRLVAPITSTGNAIWITTETATAVARSLSMINQAGQVLFCPNGTAAGTGNLSAAGSANRTEDCRQSMTLLAEALLAGTVAGEDQKRVGSTTLTLVAQRCRSDLPESCLYTTAFASPGDLAASASFPASLGLALAAATAKPPPQELTATPTGAFTGANGTANGGALPPMTVAVTLIALGSDPHHTADGDSAGRPASSIAALAFTDEAGLELHVDDMEDAAELAVELAEAYSGTVADVEVRTGSVWHGFIECATWDFAAGEYTSEGCVALPNPAPPNASLYWRSRRWNATVAAPEGEHLWGVGNPELVAGCEEVWDAVMPEYNGADIGYRKYGKYTSVPGEDGYVWDATGCPLSDPDNALGCRWDWTQQQFVGLGCEVSGEQLCLCVRLGDLVAAHALSPRRAAPDLASEMVDEEVLEAGQKAWAASAPLIVLLIVVGASTVLAAGSACAHLEEQHRVIRQLAQQGGSGMHGFRELAGAAYTWTVFGEERHYGAVRHSEQHDVIAEALGVAQAAVSCRVPAEDQGLDAISAEISMRWDEPGTAIDAAADVETDDAADEQRRRQRQLGHVEAGTDGRVGMQDNGRGAEVMQTTRLQHEGEHSEMFDIAEDSGSEEHELEAVQRLEQVPAGRPPRASSSYGSRATRPGSAAGAIPGGAASAGTRMTRPGSAASPSLAATVRPISAAPLPSKGGRPASAIAPHRPASATATDSSSSTALPRGVRGEQQLQVRVDAEDGEAPMLSAVGLSLEPLPSPGPAVSDMSPLNLPRKPNATAFAELASEAGLAPADLGAPFAASRLGEEGDHHTVAEAQGIAFVQEEGDSDPQAEASSSSLIHAGRLRGELSNSHSLQEDDEAHILDDGDDGDEHDLESTWGLATMPPRPQHGAGRPPKPHVGAGLDTEAESSDSWAMSVPNRAAPSRGHPPAPSAAPSSQESAGTGLRGARVGSAKEGGRRLLSAKAKARAETLLGGAGRELRPSTATALPRRPPSAASPSLASTLLGDAPGKEGAPTTSAASGSGDSLQLEAPTPEMSLPQLSAGDVALGGREYTEVDLGIVDDDSGEEGDLSQWNRPTTVPDLKLPASRPGSAARSRPSSAARSRPSSAARSRPSSAARGGPGSASATPRLDKMAVQNVGPEAAENVEEWRTPALQSMMERLEAEKGAKKSGLLSNLPKPKLPSLSKVSSVLQGAGPVGSEGTSPLASARGLVKSLSQAATFRGTKDKYRVAHDASLSSASTSFPSTTDPSSASGAGPVAEANSTESAENVLTLREQHAQFHASSRAEGEVKSEGTESSSRTTGVSSSAAAPQAEVPVTSSARPGLEATGSSTGRMASGGVAGASPEAGQGEKKAGKGLQRWREEAAKEEAISSEVNASQKRAKKAKERKEGQRTPAKVKSSEGSEEAGPSSAASAQVPKKPKRVASKTEKSHKEKKQKKAKRKARQRGKPVATSSAGETTDYSETEAEGEPEDPTPQAVVPELQRPTLPDAPPRPAGDGSAAPPTASEPTPAALLANTDIEDAPQGELAGAPSGVHGPHEDDSAVSGGGTSAAGGNPGEEYAANVSATAGLSSAKLVQLESPRKMAVVSDSEQKDELVPPVMPEDLRVTERLCELLGTSLTALQLSMPYASLHQAARRGQTPEAMQPLERLLGTSLVLAFLDVQRIASDPGVAAQWALVKKIRWETPAASAAPKYIDLCKVLVGAVGRQRPGWYSAALQLRLALLQLPDGSFDLSPGLAGVLHAGSPEQVLAADAVSQLSASAMMEAMPVQLRGYDAISEEARGRVWATLLAAESASTLPTSWVWNPEAPAPQRRTLEAHAVGFLRQQCQDHGELQSMHSVLQSQVQPPPPLLPRGLLAAQISRPSRGMLVVPN
ncbi:hypothetical protein CYMTET_6518 [Cymbomonas tetramitiformis]|uniref:EGF-like domain-containing protein n=1 Tax=Cymbomonas tetramitiformis TaxID=36881 RepID=A0AAE0GXD9_9CHLO|nr:hypothetical protein CYMTET_6518 [Cymbomonas tetramitiformis]